MFASLLRPQGPSPSRVHARLLASPTTASTPSPIAPRRIRLQPSQPAPSDQPDDHSADDEPEPDRAAPLLPIFSAPHLDSLPVYYLTLDLRLLVASRCETTLTWEQLRSPQVSQFLLKPIQQIIHNAHLSRATLFALMANCLQFRKEADLKPGISGASHTRAMVCELLAIKLLKEYTTRELIDALSYDFHPLQGQSPPSTSSDLHAAPAWHPRNRDHHELFKGIRISCLEIAIRAQAKRFLAHPLVVQQLEAIWAGTIVFHYAADHLHRQPSGLLTPRSQYGSFNSGAMNALNQAHTASKGVVRRSASLYDPRNASLFKLSRLRVPRYRQFLSTCSFAMLLLLFLTVVQKRSFELGSLELIFWFWSAGFMLDEIVGFNEQGFSLYLMSFWNTFDVGILFLLFCYYCLRLYSVILVDHDIANTAYDVLATTAVLLVPRLFSVLDHYRYFSQLLIAFRMMAADLLAVLILIIIACSGFFVAFTFSFGHGDSPSSVAYALFQMIMGFTPAAWQLWDRYNFLGKAILTLFLFICHFLVVTILITVLTNSFMAIVQNANEEHQFLFAVNTISMVKSDALFSYVAPTNVLAWIITPLRFIMSFRNFIKLNRTVIKATHFPILFSIYFYERAVLCSVVFEPTDLVDRPFHPNHVKAENSRFEAFTPGNTFRLREPSIATHQKDEALEEVFRRPFQQSTKRQSTRLRGPPRSVVSDWMRDIGPDGIAAPPEEENHDVLARLEQRRKIRFPGRQRRFKETRFGAPSIGRSAASDPEEFLTHRNTPTINEEYGHPLGRQLTRQTDVEGDDELSSNQNQEDDISSRHQSSPGIDMEQQETLFTPENPVPVMSPNRTSRPSTAKRLSRRNSPIRRPVTPRRRHTRNLSSATVLYNPLDPWAENDSPRSHLAKASSKSPRTKSGTNTPISPREQIMQARPRPIYPLKAEARSVPDFSGTGLFHHSRDHRSSFTMGLGSDIGDNKAVGGGFVGGVPASFATQMAFATGGLQRRNSNNDRRDTLNRLVLARMKTLEESFRELVQEVKDARRQQKPLTASQPSGGLKVKASPAENKHGGNSDLQFDNDDS
ncbi:hypothetical protein LOZ52_005665 [Ophidiomyces ophidiicola]|nr:hypothetical protein LOZ49_006463 [Ophidiomyces ophidiicola]KAI2127565.1 hypothetical protein LOZ29_006676 [Ophidiomyces ophidiicola]KAI2132723.1 hypothetical protein LOZ28_005800 [Ophidiomyces ophidiicola]KAI2211393.1 hypothetical protein LOZ15_005662 [Ophidiomyces ophidiicola]KAI2343799.1 hypothetical protein LOY92_006165 [Ophidiomyces ophidiicola]